MHTVKASGTYQSTDETKSIQLTAGDQISDEDAVEYGLISEKDVDKAAEEAASPEKRAKGPAPENRP